LNARPRTVATALIEPVTIPTIEPVDNLEEDADNPDADVSEVVPPPPVVVLVVRAVEAEVDEQPADLGMVTPLELQSPFANAIVARRK
jgi:hypothetical protein